MHQFLDARKDVALGRLAHADALMPYLHRDFSRASSPLLEWLAAGHLDGPESPFAAPELASMCGRIQLSEAARSRKDGSTIVAMLQPVLAPLGRLYSDHDTLLRIALPPGSRRSSSSTPRASSSDRCWKRDRTRRRSCASS